MKLEFSRQIFEKWPTIVRRDRQDNVNIRFSQFCERT